MPVITVEASRFTLEKKRELAKVLTKEASDHYEHTGGGMDCAHKG